VTDNEATGGTAGQGQGGRVHIAPGAIVCARHAHIARNIVSTSEDDVFGDLTEC
jgi:hypothetical protein